MLDPYRMIVVNLISSIIVFLGILFYKFIYPKKKINLFILLLIISILPVLSIFRAGAYESGDFNIHIYRIIAFFNILKEGILMPSWAADVNSSYGNPLFIFNYPLPYYIISFFHFLGIGFINSTKLYLGLVFYLSGITMYFAVKEITKNKLAAFTASIFYLFNPYHLIDVHFRATLGESTIFLIVPLLILLFSRFLKENKFFYLTLNSLITAFMVMAHPLLAIVFCVVVTTYALFYGLIKGKIRHAVLYIVSLIIGLLASFYVWISFIIFSPYMFSLPSSEPAFYAYNLLFYSPWRFGLLFQGPKGELAEIIGYTQIVIVVFLIFQYLRNKIKKSLKHSILFWTAIFLLLMFLMHPVSSIFWKHFPLFWMLLPYGRLSLIIAFCTSMLASYFAILFSSTNLKKIIVFFIIFITIGYTMLNWGHRRVIPEITDDILIKNVGSSTLTEGTTAYFLNNKWADINNFWFATPPKNHLEVIKGKAIVQQISRNSIKHEYIINASTPITIKENTLYFPGWNLKINNKNTDIYPGKRGVIYANLPKGLLHVKLEYKDIPAYKFSKDLSVAVFAFLLITLFIQIRGLFGKPKHLTR